MGPVSSCSSHSVALRKSLWWSEQEKLCSTGTPGTRMCHRLASRSDQGGIRGRRKQWRWQSHAYGKRHWWESWQLAERVWNTSLLGKTQGKERHHLIQEEVRAGVEEERVSRTVGLRQQGAWTRWESTPQRRITWSNIMQANFQRVRFLVQAVYDALPSPANLHAWGKSETPSCPLCSGRGSLEHLLSSCPKSPGQSRYRWHHDQVLKVVAESIATAIDNSKHHHAPKKSITFVKAGEKPRPQPKTRAGLLYTATDWQLPVDLGKQLKYPQHITATSLRPDMIITSDVTKQLIVLELTVPWEERIEEANERKCAKYQELVEMCQDRGWKTYYEPIEVLQDAHSVEALQDAHSAKSSTSWALRGWQSRGPFNPQAKPQIRPLGGFGLRGLIRGRLLLGGKSGLNQPRLGRLGEGV
ncbi:uncharacterized protein LOC129699945 [Leucoraja erinacea]|uniref:uncharacterized protein LOC129699945 n=1 Tax=Leucoraja erinaceus TaxID=7782 RepID=UPI002455DDDB|nr:uncharacterized protein LOC129699945 [Leucoraja erinacea]